MFRFHVSVFPRCSLSHTPLVGPPSSLTTSSSRCSSATPEAWWNEAPSQPRLRGAHLGHDKWMDDWNPAEMGTKETAKHHQTYIKTIHSMPKCSKFQFLTNQSSYHGTSLRMSRSRFGTMSKPGNFLFIVSTRSRPTECSKIWQLIFFHQLYGGPRISHCVKEHFNLLVRAVGVRARRESTTISSLQHATVQFNLRRSPP